MVIVLHNAQQKVSNNNVLNSTRGTAGIFEVDMVDMVGVNFFPQKKNRFSLTFYTTRRHLVLTDTINRYTYHIGIPLIIDEWRTIVVSPVLNVDFFLYFARILFVTFMRTMGCKKNVYIYIYSRT